MELPTRFSMQCSSDFLFADSIMEVDANETIHNSVGEVTDEANNDHDRATLKEDEIKQNVQEDGKDAGVHPFLLPHIIFDTLKNLPANDVESCRLVCHTWDVEACKVLRLKRTVVFVDPDAIRVYNNAMRNTTGFPHAQFEFCIQDFTGLVDEDLKEFWKTFGPHVKSLDFRQSHLFWRDLLEVFVKRVPNLETIRFRHLPKNVVIGARHAAGGKSVTVGRFVGRKIPSVKKIILSSIPSSTNRATERLTEIFKTFPNLEVIEFLPFKQPILQTKFSDIFVDILSKPEVSLPFLKRVKLTLELSTEKLEILTAKRLPFVYLEVNLTDGVIATTFKEYIGSLRSTLSNLRITFPESFSNLQTFASKNNNMRPEECIQVLSKLKSLNMVNFKGSVNFVQNLPQLHSLQFTSSDVAKSVPMGFIQLTPRGPGRSNQSWSMEHSLRSLKITSSCKAVAETLLLDGISRCFSVLQCLHLHGVDDDGLGVIYRNLPFLSRVQFLDARCTDQGLTGIPQEICTDMVETSTFIVVQAERYRRDLFIGSLQYLKMLSITARHITDASIALGLADCKNLKELKIGSPKITDTGVIFITDKFYKQLDVLDVSECGELTEQSKFYASEKLSGKLRASNCSDSETSNKPSVNATLLDSGRVIVKTKRQTSSVPYLSPSHIKFMTEDAEFFEEHSEEDTRERDGELVPIPFPVGDRSRQRIVRIREALRRNADFMRALQRLGIIQFRRLFRRELQDDGWRFRGFIADGDDERQPELVAQFRRRNNVNGEVENVDLEYFDGQVLEDNAVLGDFQAMLPIEGDEDDDDDDDEDGGPVHDAVANRVPEFHLAEIFRLGLRLEDVEYWLRNHAFFDREEIEAELLRNNARVDQALEEPPARNEGVPQIPVEINGDINLEAIRRVVFNAFADDLEGGVEGQPLNPQGENEPNNNNG